MLKTQEFANAIGETYTTVRNVYGRAGREPRKPGALREIDFAKGTHRRFVVADALAWRITRDLCALGLDWNQAAEIVRQERVADWAAGHVVEPDAFFGTWTGDHGWGARRGTMAEITELAEVDSRKFGRVGAVRIISIYDSVRKAEAIARDAGYELVDGEILPLTQTGA
ncbi:MAG: hypothetical protein JSS08_07760 [Proteobacteria bacterium]|nr:hypothetical protein [Pseudomonadota bacterium]